MKRKDSEEQDMLGVRLKEHLGRSRVAGYMCLGSVEYKILLDHEGRAMRLCRRKGDATFYLMGQDGSVRWSREGAPRAVPLYEGMAPKVSEPAVKS